MKLLPRSLDFFRPKGAFVRSHIFVEACMCGEVGIISLIFFRTMGILTKLKSKPILKMRFGTVVRSHTFFEACVYVRVPIL